MQLHNFAIVPVATGVRADVSVSVPCICVEREVNEDLHVMACSIGDKIVTRSDL